MAEQHVALVPHVGCPVVVWLEGNVSKEGSKESCLKLQDTFVCKKRRLLLVIEFAKRKKQAFTVSGKRGRPMRRGPVTRPKKIKSLAFQELK